MARGEEETGEWAVPEASATPLLGRKGSGPCAALPQRSLLPLLVRAGYSLILSSNAQLSETQVLSTFRDEDIEAQRGL